MTAAPADHPDGEGEFGALSAQYRSRLLAFFHRCGCADEAEDLAQETLVKFVRHRRRSPDKVIANVGAYLMQIAQNEFADYLKRKKGEPVWVAPPPSAERDDWDEDEQVSARANELMEGCDVVVLDEEAVGAIWDSIGVIVKQMDNPRQCAEIVRLAIERRSYVEIAAKVGASVDRVKNVMNRMRTKLAKLHPEWVEGRRLRGPERDARRDEDSGAADDDASAGPPGG